MLLYDECESYTLQNDGIEVVENVLDADEIVILREKMWEWLNYKTKNLDKPVVEDKTDTYASLFQLYPKHGMLFQHWDFGHNPLSWHVRQNENVIQKFASIWNTNDLLTSFDGISVSLPCEITKRGWYRGKEWFHSDQSFKRNDFECVQGLVNIYNVFQGDATLRVLKGSHKLHGKFQKRFQIQHSKDWHLLTPEQKNFYIQELGPMSDICVKAKAGSLVLWDSRTIHQGVEPQKGRPEKSIRCTPYICMTPATLASKSEIKKRIGYFEERRTCNHWPHKIKVFGKYPRTFNGPLPNVENDNNLIVTDLMKQLVGYNHINLRGKKRTFEELEDEK